MNPYRLKHVPTGLYFQNQKNGGSNLSKTGKIYGTKANALSRYPKNGYTTFTVSCSITSRVYKETKDILEWKEGKWIHHTTRTAETQLSDWIMEEIKIVNNDK